MYFQLFFRRSVSSPKFQISCDTFQEVQEEAERLGRPAFVSVHYFDQDGLVGVSDKIYDPVIENYRLISKISAR